MKFNLKTRTKKRIVNHAGGEAYKTSPELELYSAVVTSSLTNNFYEKAGDKLKRITRLIKKVDPVFVAKLAVYAREQMHLRSIPLVLVTELSKVHNGDNLIGITTSRVIQRADEITELLAYYQLSNARSGEKKLNKLSKQIQKGLAEAFYKFDEYQFAKYNRQTEVTLKDALFLTHPKANSEVQQELFGKIVNDELETPYTWEVELSNLGQQHFESEKLRADAVRDKWEELICSGKLGYMALLRNLRNILQAGVSPEAIKCVAERLSDARAVRKSKQLPFRYFSAYRELEALKLNYVSYLMDALEKAILVSAENISGFDLSTKALLAADVSGSMFSQVGGKSKVRCYDIGLILSMLLAAKSDNVFTGIFGSSWKQVNLSKSNILANAGKLDRMEGSVGYSTNGYLVVEDLIKRRIVMDKVLFFTDLQLWNSYGGNNSLRASWLNYKRQVAPNAKLYLFDLAGYGATPLSVERNDVFLIAGWSDKIFDVMTAIETRKDAIKLIKKVEL